MKYANDEARKHYEEYKRLETLEEKEQQRCNEIFRKYCQLEGKYGEIVYDGLSQGYRGYYYKYPSTEIRLQEMQEMEQFLKDNNYKTPDEINDEYAPLKQLEWNAFCFAQHGKTAKLIELENILEGYQKNIKEVEEELNFWKQKVKKTEKEIEQEKLKQK